MRRPDVVVKMARTPLYVRLGAARYRVERPWGDIPQQGGRVTDVACDARGHVFVLLRTDPYVGPESPAVVELAPSGARIAAWGGDIVADAHLMSVDADGRLFVVDRDAHEVIVFDGAGRRINGIGHRHHPGEPFRHPCDVAISDWGDIYVADGYGASSVHRFDRNLKLLSSFGSPGDGPGQFSTPHAIWASADRCIAVIDRENNRLQIFTAEGKFLWAWTDVYKPMAIFGTPAGHLYVTDSVPRLTMLSWDGELLGRCRPVLNGAHGLSGDLSGNLYLAEGNPSRVTRLVPVPGGD
jgi:hypothetical protein